MTGHRREPGLVQRARQSANEHVGSLPARVLVGFSGGADSLALVGALAALQRSGSMRVHAVHVDHGARETSAAEARVVAGTSRALGVEMTIWTVEPERLREHAGVGREEAMRRERYLAFAHVAAAEKCDVVALAHHQRDQAETVLMHILRGAGLRGARGMSALSEMTVPWWGHDAVRRVVRIWRPFLDEPAAALRSFAESLDLPIVDDPSNQDPSFRRNAIRHEALPVLERVSPGATGSLARFGKLIADEDQVLESLAADVVSRLLDRRFLTREALSAAARGLRRRVVRRWLMEQLPLGMELSLNRVDQVLGAMETSGPAREIQIAAGMSVMVRRDGAEVVGGESGR